jgi:uncharacterized membrane protein YfcA
VGLKPMKRRIYYYVVLALGMICGIVVGGWIFSLLTMVILNLLGMLFPHSVIERPIDYAGPLPDVAFLIALILFGLVFILVLLKYHQRINAFFRLALQEMLDGQFRNGAVKTILLGSISGLYAGGIGIPLGILISSRFLYH